MKQALALVFTGLFALTAQAADLRERLPEDMIVPVEEADLSQFLWRNRLVLVFAETEFDPRFEEQILLLAERPEALAERDVKVILDSDPALQSELRTRFRPRGFMLVLVGKDGFVYLRKPLPWNVREISRSIDKLPQRQQEIRDRRGS